MSKSAETEIARIVSYPAELGFGDAPCGLYGDVARACKELGDTFSDAMGVALATQAYSENELSNIVFASFQTVLTLDTLSLETVSALAGFVLNRDLSSTIRRRALQALCQGPMRLPTTDILSAGQLTSTVCQALKHPKMEAELEIDHTLWHNLQKSIGWVSRRYGEFDANWSADFTIQLIQKERSVDFRSLRIDELEVGNGVDVYKYVLVRIAMSVMEPHLTLGGRSNNNKFDSTAIVYSNFGQQLRLTARWTCDVRNRIANLVSVRLAGNA